MATKSDPLFALRACLIQPGLADLGPGPRQGVLSVHHLNDEIDRVVKSSSAREILRALLLLWNDHHDEAHRIVQDGHTQDASLIHGILHRREPDYGNARYWFHRVGDHPSFVELAARLERFVGDDVSADEKKKLLRKGKWDPDAFVAACESLQDVTNQASRVRFLQEVQRMEFEVLLEQLYRTL